MLFGCTNQKHNRYSNQLNSGHCWVSLPASIQGRGKEWPRPTLQCKVEWVLTGTVGIGWEGVHHWRS